MYVCLYVTVRLFFSIFIFMNVSIFNHYSKHSSNFAKSALILYDQVNYPKRSAIHVLHSTQLRKCTGARSGAQRVTRRNLVVSGHPYASQTAILRWSTRVPHFSPLRNCTGARLGAPGVTRRNLVVSRSPVCISNSYLAVSYPSLWHLHPTRL